MNHQQTKKENKIADNPQVGTQRTGGRSARIKQSILDSAMTELTSVGYDQFHIGNVAKRAGVHETTVYRRWKTKELLIADVCMSFADINLPIPNTGNVKDDLRIVLKNIVTLIESPLGKVLVSLSFVAHHNQELKMLSLSLWHQRIKIGQTVLDRAVECGEWAKGFNREEVFSELIGPLLAQAFLLQQPLTDEIIEVRLHALITLYGC